MAQYINKDALVAEMERRIKSINSCPFRTGELGSEKLNEGQLNAYDVMLSFINTLEVKEVDLDLEKDIDAELRKRWYGEYLDIDKFYESAKHFFELGLKAQKGE